MQGEGSGPGGAKAGQAALCGALAAVNQRGPTSLIKQLGCTCPMQTNRRCAGGRHTGWGPGARHCRPGRPPPGDGLPEPGPPGGMVHSLLPPFRFTAGPSSGLTKTWRSHYLPLKVGILVRTSPIPLLSPRQLAGQRQCPTYSARPPHLGAPQTPQRSFSPTAGSLGGAGGAACHSIPGA